MRVPVLALFSLLAFAACDSDDPVSPGGKPNGCGPTVPEADFARRYFEARCALEERCGYIPPGAVDRCADLYQAYGYDQTFAYLLADPHVVYDGAAMACCFEDMLEMSCFGSDAVPASCNLALRGTLANGEACSEGFQCAEANCLEDEGRCAPAPRDGESCEDNCAEGLICAWDDEDEWGEFGTCQPYGGVGDPCGYHDDCGPGLLCDAAWNGEDYVGTCKPPAASGERCTEWLPCATPDLYCARTASGSEEGTCVARLAAGAACSPDVGFDDDPGCSIGLDCRSQGSGSVCVVPADEGEPCVAFRDCAYGLICFEGTCEAFLAPGESCEGREDLCVGRCADGVCLAEAWD